MTTNFEFMMMMLKSILIISATLGGAATAYAFLMRNKNDMWKRITTNDVKGEQEE